MREESRANSSMIVWEEKTNHSWEWVTYWLVWDFPIHTGRLCTEDCSL